MVRRLAVLAVWFGWGISVQWAVAAPGQWLDDPVRAPEFTQTDAQAWLNSAPIALDDLRGKVVLLDFWTFDCWNCYRSFPWLNTLEQRLADSPFQVIGIHSPEFAHERYRGNLAAKLVQFKLEHPVMMDNDFRYWQMMGNRYWPTFYLLDKRAQIRAVFIGETHADSQQAQRVEQMIRALLKEP